MTHLIDKDALVAEIDNRIYRRKKEYNILEESEIWKDALKLKERINELVDLRTQILFNTLDTVEVKKENDLEKEFFNWYHEEKNRDYNASVLYERYGTISKNLAKHFFELGLKAQKGE